MLFDKRSSRNRARRAESRRLSAHDSEPDALKPRARSTARPATTRPATTHSATANSESASAARATKRRLARRDLVKSARPLLDPHGLYGTRTAQRRRAVRRRRSAQQILLTLLFLGAIGSAFWRLISLRHASGGSLWSVKCDAHPSSPPLRLGNFLLIPTFDGTLFSVRAANFPMSQNENERNLKTANAPFAPSVRQIFRADFPIRVTPIALGSSSIVASEDGVLARVEAQSARQIWRWKSHAAISTRPILLRIATISKVVTPPNRVLDSAAPTMKSKLETLVITGNDAGQIVALDARNGAVLWSRELGAPVGSAFAVSPSMAQIYVPLLGTTNSRGALVSLNAQNGAVLWRAETGAACAGAPVCGATMAQGRAPRVFVATDNGAVFSFDAANGKRIWKVFAVNSVNPNAANKQAVVLRGEPLFKVYAWGARLFVGDDNGNLHCFEAREGREQWNFAFEAPLLQRPNPRRTTVGDSTFEQIIAGAGREIYAFDARNGAVVWRAQPRGELAGFTSDAQTLQSLSTDGRVEGFALN